MNVTGEKNQEVNSWQRWLVLLLSPILWMGYFMLVYLLDEAGCRLGFWNTPIWGQLTVIGLISLGVTVVVLLAIIYLGYRGLKLWQETEVATGEDAAMNVRVERDRFIGLSTVMLSVLFGVMTLGLAVTFLALHPC